MCVRARSTAVSRLEATAGGSVAGFALRAPAAASGSPRSPARACRECRARAGCAPRGWPCGALRAGSAPPAGSDAAPASPDARSLRAARGATRLRRPTPRARRERHPAEVARRQHERRDHDRVDAVRRVELAHRLRQARDRRRRIRRSRSSPACSRTDAPPCSRAAAPACPSPGSSLVKSRSSTYAIHRSQRCCVARLDQPDAAGVALAFFDQRLHEHAEEALDVRLAHEEVERELHGIALDVRHALGPAPLVDLAGQRVGPCLRGGSLHQLARDHGGRRRIVTRVVKWSPLLRLSCVRLHARPPCSPLSASAETSCLRRSAEGRVSRKSQTTHARPISWCVPGPLGSGACGPGARRSLPEPGNSASLATLFSRRPWDRCWPRVAPADSWRGERRPPAARRRWQRSPGRLG